MKHTCRQCSQTFEITKDDLAFYKKVSPIFGGTTYDIPAPTLCPACRNQRRMAWRNDRSFYQRTSSLSGKPIISIYPEGTPFPVYHQSEWYGDGWNPMDYGTEIDLSRSFFEQLTELRMRVPRLGMDTVNCENSDYCNYCGDDKNCYLDIAGESNEDCYYNLFTKYSKNCVDCTFAYHSVLCHECIQVYGSHGLRSCMYMEDCSDCAFCFDCKGCKNCLLSTNLRNKEYCVMNEQCTKEEYEKKRQELGLDRHSSLQHIKDLWKQIRIERGVYRDMYTLNSEDCTGNDIKNSKDCHLVFNVSGSRDCTYLYDVLDATDCQDLNYSLYKPEVAYELISTLSMRFSAFCMASHYCSNVYYTDLTNHSNDLFGCIGLTHKEYCILNKQYTKEEYEELVPKIIERMLVDGEWGEFLPIEMSLFGYNETVAQEYMPLTKEKVTASGWRWTDDEREAVSAAPYDVPDAIGDVPDDIVKQPIVCEATGRPFKIIPQELTFYREMQIPIPRKRPDERHKDRIALRTPRKLWDRQCANCHKPIATSYAPDRSEKVLCKACYLKEVY